MKGDAALRPRRPPRSASGLHGAAVGSGALPPRSCVAAGSEVPGAGPSTFPKGWTLPGLGSDTGWSAVAGRSERPPRVAGGRGWPRARQLDLGGGSRVLLCWAARGWSQRRAEAERNPSRLLRVKETHSPVNSEAFSWEPAAAAAREQVIQTGSAGAPFSTRGGSCTRSAARGGCDLLPWCRHMRVLQRGPHGQPSPRQTATLGPGCCVTTDRASARGGRGRGATPPSRCPLCPGDGSDSDSHGKETAQAGVEVQGCLWQPAAPSRRRRRHQQVTVRVPVYQALRRASTTFLFREFRTLHRHPRPLSPSPH